MVKVFQDILWTVCFVASGNFLLSQTEHENSDHDHVHHWSQQFWYKGIAIPLICLAPLWIRFNQCLRRYLDTGKRMPNLANAFKYAMSQSVTLFGAFHPLYLMHSGQGELTVSLSNDDDDGQEGSIVIGSYRSNFFQVRIFRLHCLYFFKRAGCSLRYLLTNILYLFSFSGRDFSLHRHFTAFVGMYTWIGALVGENMVSSVHV